MDTRNLRVGHRFRLLVQCTFVPTGASQQDPETEVGVTVFKPWHLILEVIANKNVGALIRHAVWSLEPAARILGASKADRCPEERDRSPRNARTRRPGPGERL